MGNRINAEEVFEKAKAASSEKKSKCELYRKTIVLLKLKDFTYKGIAAFLNDNGVNVKAPSISLYLKKSPITDAEKKQLAKFTCKN